MAMAFAKEFELGFDSAAFAYRSFQRLLLLRPRPLEIAATRLECGALLQ
jgi:hypothetical protein